MGKFYVYRVKGSSCVKIDGLDLSLSRKVPTASYFSTLRAAKSWEGTIKKTYPTAELIECEFAFKITKKRLK